MQRVSTIADAVRTLCTGPPIGYAVEPRHGPVLTQVHIPACRAVRQPTGEIDEWDLGPFTHVRDVRLGPAAARRGFRFQARGGHIGDLLHADQYSDEFTGISGNGPGNDPVVAHFILSGWARFENEAASVTVKPGQVVFRDTHTPWRFWFGRATRSRILTVPRHELAHYPALTGRPPGVVVTDASRAEVRLLDGYLELARGIGGETFSGPGRAGGQEAAVQLLLAAMGAAGAPDSAGHPQAALAAARRFIDGHLDDPDLDPQAIARALHMSVRSVHRAFADADDSVMAYVRRQRLHRARTQLMDPGTRVAEVAARWQFSDTSHFVRRFKAVYGVTPATFAREERRAAMEGR